ncbi:FAD-dependent oxidoreductase [Promicromonospora thailandica]|uniref:Flavin containing amine oxidoreductase n=1 Tax=Promicromonospora thailandica TaxID=765201 RepID=A0A9X2JW60_9MICO|nr:FAD-dependent oxidoreductase [Promicromonospora thailandica]MCP2265801.1 Flavin containing amine oxidoreductase [Promicromonospora thailandica]
MNLSRKEMLRLIGAGAGAVALGSAASPAAGSETGGRGDIVRDVAVIGGGAAGTYAAIRLRELGQSVVVVERNGRLGGHTQTYTDPATGGTVDIGVVVWHDQPLVRQWFERFDIPLRKASFGGETLYVDHRTGRAVPDYTPPNPAAALALYGEHLARFPYLEYGFELPDPVPTDLLLPFGEFVRRYDLDAVVPTVFQFGQGLGDLLRQPTLYVMKNFGSDILRNLQIGFVSTSRRDNSELYRKARTELGDDVLLNSRVVSTDRDGARHATVRVDTPAGRRTIRARKVLVTIPPLLGNLDGFDLDGLERHLFGQFRNSAYYTGVLRDSGIPDSLQVRYIGLDTPHHLPELPGVYNIAPTGIPGLHNVKFGSPVALSERAVQAEIRASVRRLGEAGTLPATPPELATFASHTPFELTVSAEAVRAGFYRRLGSLQGRNRTFYSGAAFHTHDSSLIWQFTETLLPRIATA